jgi:hypothetical protein
MPAGKFTVKDLHLQNPAVTVTTCNLHVLRGVKAGKIIRLDETVKAATVGKPARLFELAPEPVAV